MRASQFLLALSLVSVFGLGCSKSPSHVSGPGSASLAEQQELYQSWTHSWEEDTQDGVQVFRPTTSMEFPGAHFRQVYRFGQDRTGERLVLHPADAHSMESMSWTWDRRNPRLVHLADPAGNEVASFEILELTPQLMRIRYSHLSATVGSMRSARRAGRYAASRVTASISGTTIA